jgi:hypothetical protein
LKYYALIAVLLTTCISTSAFSEPDWINIATSPDNKSRWDIKPGSLEFSETRGGTSIATVIGKVHDTKTSHINLYRWYVSATDCKNKMGKVVSLNISGDFLFDNDFVFGSGSIATAIAEIICGAANYNINEINDKSL